MTEYTLELRTPHGVEHTDFDHMPTLQEIIDVACKFGHSTVFYQGKNFNTHTGLLIGDRQI